MGEEVRYSFTWEPQAAGRAGGQATRLELGKSLRLWLATAKILAPLAVVLTVVISFVAAGFAGSSLRDPAATLVRGVVFFVVGGAMMWAIYLPLTRLPNWLTRAFRTEHEETCVFSYDDSGIKLDGETNGYWLAWSGIEALYKVSDSIVIRRDWRMLAVPDSAFGGETDALAFLRIAQDRTGLKARGVDLPLE